MQRRAFKGERTNALELAGLEECSACRVLERLIAEGPAADGIVTHYTGALAQWLGRCGLTIDHARQLRLKAQGDRLTWSDADAPAAAKLYALATGIARVPATHREQGHRMLVHLWLIVLVRPELHHEGVSLKMEAVARSKGRDIKAHAQELRRRRFSREAARDRLVVDHDITVRRANQVLTGIGWPGKCLQFPTAS